MRRRCLCLAAALLSGCSRTSAPGSVAPAPRRASSGVQFTDGTQQAGIHFTHFDGGGKFTDVTKQTGVGGGNRVGTSCAWLDFDNDGWLDLFVCHYVQYSLATDHPCYEAGKRLYCRPLVYKPDTCTLYHNNGDGT